MNALNIAEYTQTLGMQAKAASALMAKASTATKNVALKRLAALLRANAGVLAQDNAKDIARAEAAGLAAPMVDRLRLTPKVIETVALGCEQLAAMPDIIGEVIGMKQQPSGIRVGQMRVPIGVFGMIFESRPNVTIERPACRSRAAMPASCAAARRRSSPTRRWRNLCSRRWWSPACRPMRCSWCRPPNVRWWAS